MRKSELLEKINKLQKQLDDVTNVVDLMAKIEHARQDKIKEKKYLYVYQNYSEAEFASLRFSTIKKSMINDSYIGEIRLEGITNEPRT